VDHERQVESQCHGVTDVTVSLPHLTLWRTTLHAKSGVRQRPWWPTRKRKRRVHLSTSINGVTYFQGATFSRQHHPRKDSALIRARSHSDRTAGHPHFLSLVLRDACPSTAAPLRPVSHRLH